MDDFKGNPSSLVADVDCTTEGKDLCSKHGVKGYPAIKYGDPGDLKDYNGGRTYEALKKFADENLGPTCGPDNMDLCDEATKTIINKLMEMSADRLQGKMRNAIRVVEEEVPLMKKVLAHKSKTGEKKEL